MGHDSMDIHEMEAAGERIGRLYRRWNEAFEATARVTSPEERVRLQARLGELAKGLREFEEALYWEDDPVPSAAELVKGINDVYREVERLTS